MHMLLFLLKQILSTIIQKEELLDTNNWNNNADSYLRDTLIKLEYRSVEKIEPQLHGDKNEREKAEQQKQQHDGDFLKKKILENLKREQR